METSPAYVKLTRSAEGREGARITPRPGRSGALAAEEGAEQSDQPGRLAAVAVAALAARGSICVSAAWAAPPGW
jgi:hypothetical protein